MTSTAHRVLVVEDEANIRNLLADMLRFEGYDVATAQNGLHAMALLDGRPSDVILLDLMMPLMDGFTFRGKQLLSARLADIPVIVLSAKFLVDGELERLRPFAWLAKPFDIGLLLRAVASACDDGPVHAAATPGPGASPIAAGLRPIGVAERSQQI
jgi:DNA-binding response OmpR family regulator